GYAVIRAEFPVSSTGIMEAKTTVTSGTTNTVVTLIVDMDYLKANIPHTGSGTVNVASLGNLANWHIEANDTGLRNAITLVKPEDFSGRYYIGTDFNFQWDNFYGSTAPVKIPEGTATI